MVFAALYPEAYILCLGDFNLLLNTTLDRHGDTLTSEPQCPSAFNQLVTEFGWHDLWRTSNPCNRAFSWSVPTRGCLSRIELAFGNDKTITKVSSITYLTRGVSEHSSLLITFDTGYTGVRRPWRVQPSWLSLIGANYSTNGSILDEMHAFLEAHGPARDLMFWDTLKAYLREALKFTIAYINKSSHQDEKELA